MSSGNPYQRARRAGNFYLLIAICCLVLAGFNLPRATAAKFDVMGGLTVITLYIGFFGSLACSGIFFIAASVCRLIQYQSKT